MILTSKFFPGIASLTMTLVVAMLWSCDVSKSQILNTKTAFVTFSVDWSDVKSSQEVTSASIFVYPTTGDAPIVMREVSVEKTTVEVPAGTYRVIIHNENLTKIKMRNTDSYSDFEAYVDIQNRESVVGNTPTTFVPSLEYLHLLTGTANRELAVTGGEPFSIILKPKTATYSYRFTVSMPSKLKYESISAVLGGIASRFNLFAAKPSKHDISSIDIPLARIESPNSGDTLKWQGIVETFGVDPENRQGGVNTLYVDLKPTVEDPDLKTHFENDLTKFFTSYSNNSLDIDIRIDNPDPIKPDVVEFHITVKPWIIDDGGHVDLEPDLSNVATLQSRSVDLSKNSYTIYK